LVNTINKSTGVMQVSFTCRALIILTIDYLHVEHLLGGCH
jgi:hypothetical protein